MDFQFINDSDVLLPVTSVVVAAVIALLIGSCIRLKGPLNSGNYEGCDTGDTIVELKRARL